ncbi:MAG: hypothetical protein UY04_C0028G0009 [Parcubacteria group bacterium GW2011_GWA2_47_7]|nr:MAG: hypothetical protein UY04_C0028G0009 [Parcubacteria group bacterium GW2011_GWA2_47_7]
MYVPVVQWIGYLPPKEMMQVRFLPGALSSYCLSAMLHIVSNKFCIKIIEELFVKIKKPVFGVDVDDVLFGCVEAICAYLNRVHGYTIRWTDVTTFYFDDLLGLSMEEARRIVYPFHFSEEHDNMRPISGAHEALCTLAKTYRPVAITARSVAARTRTIALVERYFPGLFSEFYFTGYVAGQPRRTKGDVCASVRASFMVEDALHNACTVGEKGIRVYLMDQPWNQCDILPPNTIRVFHWDDVLRHESLI